MDWDDIRAKPKVDIVVGEKLDNWSVDELRQRIDALKVEIARVETELQAKIARAAAADQLFKP